jgi:hypothetical protein
MGDGGRLIRLPAPTLERAAHVRKGVHSLIEHQVDLSSDQILHCRSGTPIGYELKARARLFLKIGTTDMRGAADASIARSVTNPRPFYSTTTNGFKLRLKNFS